MVKIRKDLEDKVQEIAMKLGVEPHIIRYTALAIGLEIIRKSLNGSEEGKQLDIVDFGRSRGKPDRR